MPIKIPALSFGNRPDVEPLPRLHPHPFERVSSRYGRNQERPAPLETDEASVEQMVDAGHQQKPILAVEALFIGVVPPRFTVARPQVFRVADAGDSAPPFDGRDPLSEYPLPPSGLDDGLPLGLWNRDVALDRLPQVTLPGGHVAQGRVVGRVQIGPGLGDSQGLA